MYIYTHDICRGTAISYVCVVIVIVRGVVIMVLVEVRVCHSMHGQCEGDNNGEVVITGQASSTGSGGIVRRHLVVGSHWWSSCWWWWRRWLALACL